MNILVIDDDTSLRRTIRMSLEVLGHQAVEARDGPEALDLLAHRPFEMALLDLRLAQEQGLDLLPRLLSVAPGLQVVIVTAYATIETAVEAMRRGAFDYLPKPFTPDQLRMVLERIERMRWLQFQVEDLGEQVRAVVPEVDLQTNEPGMRQALNVAFKTAATEATILLRGESGTGKGVVARAIHARSARAEKPFVTIHCPSLSAELAGERVVRPRAGGLHWRGARYVGQSGRCRRRHPVPRRDRRFASGVAAEAVTPAPGAVLRAGGRDADPGQQRAGAGGHQSQPGGRQLPPAVSAKISSTA